MEARAENNILVINEQKSIEFPYPIDDLIIWNNSLAIVCTDTKNAKEGGRDTWDNVYAFDGEGRFKWQMEHDGGGHIGIVASQGKLYVYDINSMKYQLDPDTGKILDKIRPTGRPW